MEEEEENGSSNIDEEEEGEGENEIRERKCRNGVSTILRLLGYPGPGDDNDQQLDPWMIRVLKKNTIKETETDEKSSSYSSCWSNYLKPNNKKKKKKKSNTKMNKINVRLQYSNPPPPPHPQLPQNFQSKINESGGWNVGFVIEKRLFSSDVSCGQGRFAFSMKQVVNEFLSDEEKKSLSSSSSTEKDIEVKLIDPAGAGAEVRSMKLTKWNTNYVLKTNWMTVVKDNRLKENTRVQLWSFRVQNNKLYFALIKLQDELKLDS